MGERHNKSIKLKLLNWICNICLLKKRRRIKVPDTILVHYLERNGKFVVKTLNFPKLLSFIGKDEIPNSNFHSEGGKN